MAQGIRIGLTGGIGSGKSSVAAEWVACGAILVDTDAIARALTAPGGAALPALAAAFGAELITAEGALDRDRMRKLVFADPASKRALEGILHPIIGEQAMAQANAAGHYPVVFDVPLMTESSAWRVRADRVAVVDCSTQTQIERVMLRNGWSRQAVEDIIHQQAPRQRRRRIADAVIFNDAIDRDRLRAEARQLWRLWVGPGQTAVEQVVGL